MHATCLDPALERQLRAVVRRALRSAGRRVASDTVDDVMQDLRLQVVDLSAKYRGDNGAQLATYLYSALVTTARLALSRYQLPVHVGKGNPARWRIKRAEAPKTVAGSASFDAGGEVLSTSAALVDPMDNFPTPTPAADEALDTKSLSAHLRDIALLAADGDEDLAEEVMLMTADDEASTTASARTGRPLKALRRAALNFRTRVENDQALRLRLQARR